MVEAATEEGGNGGGGREAVARVEALRAVAPRPWRSGLCGLGWWWLAWWLAW